MGASFARDIPTQPPSNLFYGDGNPLKPQHGTGGRRTMPSGPLLPTLPRNPFAITAQKIGKLSTPYQPKNLNDML